MLKYFIIDTIGKNYLYFFYHGYRYRMNRRVRVTDRSEDLWDLYVLGESKNIKLETFHDIASAMCYLADDFIDVPKQMDFDDFIKFLDREQKYVDAEEFDIIRKTKN